MSRHNPLQKKRFDGDSALGAHLIHLLCNHRRKEGITEDQSATSKVAYTFSKSETQEVRASLATHEGRRLGHIRTYCRNRNGEFRPTKMGIAVEVEQLPDLLIAVACLCAFAKDGS